MRLLISVFIVLLAASVSLPQGNAGDVIKKMQQKFNSVNDLSADFKQTAASGGLSGKFYFKKKDRFRIELKSLIITGDGKNTWNYNVKTKKYIVNNFDPNDPSNLSLNRFVYDYPAKCGVSIAGSEMAGGSECTVIELKPKSGELNFKKAKLWKDGQDLIRKIMFEESGGTVITVELSNIKLNQKLPDSKFTLTPPEGSKVIDLR